MSITDTSASFVGGLIPVEFRVPQPHDHDDFMRGVEARERARLRELGQIFWEISRAKTIDEGASYAAQKRAHLSWGFSAKTLKDLFRLWVNGGHKPGDWKKTGAKFPPRDFRALCRAYRNAKGGLPQEFLLFWGGVYAEFRGRGDAITAAHEKLVKEIWLAGLPVPGYGIAADWYAARSRALPNRVLVRPGDLPEGWSLDNLRGNLPARIADKEQLAHGYLAAHSHLADQVLKDRAPLLPLERVFLDDLRPDFRCLHLAGATGEIVYPLIVLGLDAASGVDLANCAKPRALKNDDSGERHGITRNMTLLVALETIRRWGLPKDYPITFVCENAAAALTREDRDLFKDAFGERVQFEETAIFRERMTANGFTESGGCPWGKAPLEAFFRPLQTRLAALPGSTGPRYDEKHGELAQMEDYALALIDGAQGIESVLTELRSPLLRFDAAHDAINRALHLLRFRTRHKLQGFDRVVEWRADAGSPWQPEAKLGEFHLANPDARPEIITRLESPAERFVKKLSGVTLEPVDPDLLDWIQGPRFAVRVRNGKITLNRKELAAEPITFRESGHALLEPEHEGREFQAALAPDASALVLGDEGRLVGRVQRQDRIAANDAEALKREAGRVRAARVADRNQLAGYLADRDTGLALLRSHNDRVLSTPRIAESTSATPASEEKSAPISKQRDRAKLLANAALNSLPQ